MFKQANLWEIFFELLADFPASIGAAIVDEQDFFDLRNCRCGAN
jgi:hypothetical protein